MADRSKLYDKKDKPKAEAKVDEKKGEDKAMEKKAESEGKESEGTKMADEAHEAGESKGIDQMFEGLGTMLKAHESEYRDHSGNHVASVKQMHQRHQKAIREYMAKHMEGLKSGQGVTAEEQAPANNTEAPVEE